jgi:hypothetical protein
MDGWMDGRMDGVDGVDGWSGCYSATRVGHLEA